MKKILLTMILFAAIMATAVSARTVCPDDTVTVTQFIDTNVVYEKNLEMYTGNTFQYKITLTNSAPTALNYWVQVKLPNDNKITFISSNPTCDNTVSGSDRQFTCDPVTVPANGSTDIIFTLQNDMNVGNEKALLQTHSKVSCANGNGHGEYEFFVKRDTSGPPGTQIPEFPTAALPVLAAIGMAFVFTRKP